MSRADLLVSLLSSGTHGDAVTFRQTAEQLIADERQKHHYVLADRLSESIKRNGRPVLSPKPAESQSSLFFESTPQRALDELTLPETARQACVELVEEQHRADLLHSHGLSPRHRILLGGAPGNGKTSLAEALAEALMVPLVTVRYEGLVGSYLGETTSRLQKVFDYVATRRCVLFFDEFDTVGKERGDVHETGEIKRVVSTLLLQTDRLPDYVVIVAASNHPELLDRAVWRRFQLRLSLPRPTRRQLSEFIAKFADRHNIGLGYAPTTLAEKLLGVSFAEAQEFCTDIFRRAVLEQCRDDAKPVVRERLSQWSRRLTPTAKREKPNGRPAPAPVSKGPDASAA